MAFSKKKWSDRSVQYANRKIFTPTGNANEYDVTRNEGTVFSEGYRFNATNMNDLENRIGTEFGLKQDKAWTQLTSVTGTGSITIPLTFNEMHISVQNATTAVNYVFHLLPIDIVAGQDIRQGFYNSAGSNGIVIISITSSTTLNLTENIVSGTSHKTTTVTTVSYR